MVMVSSTQDRAAVQRSLQKMRGDDASFLFDTCLKNKTGDFKNPLSSPKAEPNTIRIDSCDMVDMSPMSLSHHSLQLRTITKLRSDLSTAEMSRLGKILLQLA